ncbi:hypothetical protein FGO68_gene9120 [Halteria grandinella]|uniref:Uncharacterized protein n=1 Tax=Halteria grandinella TaxID=5974 RepID=A0A8J8NB30_HALGN|nr:hypothetical protein FGO68_gene9120 [Halteria grandinella]
MSITSFSEKSIISPAIFTCWFFKLIRKLRHAPVIGSYDSQCSNCSISKLPSSSRLILDKRLRLNSAVIPDLSLQAFNMVNGFFLRSKPISTISSLFNS